jgi:DNA-binding LytR/AlgR family response regulator
VQGLITAEPVVIGLTVLSQVRRRKQQLAVEAGEEPPNLFELLGMRPSDVLCLQIEDHYVRVYTEGSSRLMLATLNQALMAVENADGMQVHRSWWVARKAVARPVAEGRNLRLQLVKSVMARLSAPPSRRSGQPVGSQRAASAFADQAAPAGIPESRHRC